MPPTSSARQHLGVDAYPVKPVGYPTLILLVRKICRHWDLENLNGKKDAN